MQLPACSGPANRREFMCVGLLALGGATLSDLIAARAAMGRHAPDTSVILFWMWGGPSQFEHFDDARRRIDRERAAASIEEFRAAALQMLTNPGVARAFDLSKEDPRLRDHYGRHLWGQSCLLARRLAESGVAVVTIDALAPVVSTLVYFSWDDHANAGGDLGWDLAKGMRWRAKYMDQAFSALIEDIYDRGLDRKILVVAMGEFGRTPRIGSSNGCLGRDHWPQSMSALISGGGLLMGQVVGATNARGEYPKERPLTPQDMLATIYRHLGIDPRQEFLDTAGRPIPILWDGQPIEKLL